MSEILGALFKYLLAALGIGAVVAVLYTALGNNKTQDAISQQTQLQTNIQSAYAGLSNFTSLNNARVIAGNLAPASMVVAGVLQNPWNGAVTAAVNANAAQFDITHAAVPKDGCAKFAASQNNAVAITVNGAGLGIPVDAGLAITACNAAANTVVFTYAR